jgi:hypothetical protein
MNAAPWARFIIWRDTRRRAAKLLRRVRTADAVVVSAGKSGRTWLRAMLSHIYHLRHGVPESELIGFDNFNAYHNAIPRILFTGVESGLVAPSGRTWGEEVASIDRIVLLTRDPRDVAVSFYFQLTERATERELNRKGFGSREVLREMSIGDFLLNEQLGVTRGMRFVEGWQRVILGRPNTLMVSYEQLCSDCHRNFGRVARFLDPRTRDHEVVAAVAFGDFNALRAREERGFFNSERLRSSGSCGPEGRKVRRGKIGGYRDYLKPAEVAAVDRLVAPVCAEGDAARPDAYR